MTRKKQTSPKRDHTKRFILAVIIFIIVAALVSGMSAYTYVRSLSMTQDMNVFNQLIDDYSLLDITDVSGVPNQSKMILIGKRLLARSRISDVAFFSPQNKLIWTSSNWSSSEQLNLSEQAVFKSTTSWVWGDFEQFIQAPSYKGLLSVLESSKKSFVTVSRVVARSGSPVVLIKTLRDYSVVTKSARMAAIGGFFVVLLTGLMIFIISFRLFRRNIQIIKGDEDQLSKKILKLSDSLDENEQLQRNMKSASSRAVELNERFLRRVGSDLHDGPAQSIGYAVLRLNQINSKHNSKELGHDFHAVKEALNESLEEIRGISSGLVLPELEQMSLEESIGKIIQRHQMNNNTTVKESYFNLPDDIPLPIKICAYRFAQEGLNNAYKHGNAEKCRFTAQVIDDVLHLSLKDNGMGFRKSVLNTDGGHLGLAGMKDRIESLGGKLNLNSELGVGTAIKASVPIIGYD